MSGSIQSRQQDTFPDVYLRIIKILLEQKVNPITIGCVVDELRQINNMI